MLIPTTIAYSRETVSDARFSSARAAATSEMRRGAKVSKDSILRPAVCNQGRSLNGMKIQSTLTSGTEIMIYAPPRYISQVAKSRNYSRVSGSGTRSIHDRHVPPGFKDRQFWVFKLEDFLVTFKALILDS